MFRFVVAALAALFVGPAFAAEVDCSLNGPGYIIQGVRMNYYNFGKLLLAPQSDVKTMLTYSSNPPTANADVIEMWRAMQCAATRRVPDQVARSLQDHWATTIRVNLNGFAPSLAYRFFVDVAEHVRPHLYEQTLSPGERELLADTARWARDTGNPRFARTLAGLTEALKLPLPH